MLEAAASGCAILTSKGSGMTDLIFDGRNGMLVDPGNISQIASGITELLQDDKRRLALASSVQSDVIASWSWTAKGKELEGIYEDFISD